MHVVETVPERLYSSHRPGSKMNKDSLTGLPDEAALRTIGPRIIRQTIARKQKGCVAIVDLNGLQAINDASGNLTGDRILRSVGRMLADMATPGGMAARIGDDEFALILRGMARREVIRLMDGLHRRVSEMWPSRLPFESKGVSVGVAWFPEEGHSLELLLVQADFRMHIDKRNKKTEHILALEALEALDGEGASKPI